ncbi:MAG: HlyD family efflux transporter periplasmic adaptor subunit [Planctomycetales bacterium]|nr:HlyD family efflux transporter periplasmic adaptor subunit [Planctomycetales bacterium]
MHNPSLPPLVRGLTITVHRQADGLWYAIRSPDKRFLRLGPREYLIASVLDGQRSAAEVVAAVRETQPQAATSEEEVLQVASWLAKMGLLASAGAAPGVGVGAGGPTAAPSPAAGVQPFAFNPIYTKLPLLPGRHLEWVAAWFAPLFGLPLAVAAVLLWLVAGLSVLSQWNQFAAATSDLFVSDRYLWWAAAWLLLKTAHELGHAVAAMRVGSAIRSAGISLIFMAPVPYVDISDLWAISNRWQRVLTCAAGMLVELTLAAAAALLALSTDNQSLQYFCCAVATMGTLTTLAFNASPFIRFDGYFIISDLINYPNLYTDAQLAARQFLLKCFRPFQATQHKMSFGLVTYGLACYQYRLVMMLTIAVGTILAFQGLGLALVAWGAYAMLLAPWLKARRERARTPAAAQTVASGPRPLAAVLERCWAWGAAGLLGLLLFLPSPIQPAIPGYVALRQPLTLRSATDGFVDQVLLLPGSPVEPGQLIAVLDNPTLKLELALKRNQLAAVQETIRQKRAMGNLAELQSQQAQLESLQLQHQQLAKKVQGLQIRSPIHGYLVQNNLHRSRGLFLTAGEPLALIAKPDEYEVVASVDQNDVENFRAVLGQSLSVRISGGLRLEGILEKVDPRASDRLHTPLLAAAYGGPIAVQMQAERGDEEFKMLTPRFEARVQLNAASSPAATPGQMAWLRIPGRSANLFAALHRWWECKWNDLQQNSS